MARVLSEGKRNLAGWLTSYTASPAVPVSPGRSGLYQGGHLVVAAVSLLHWNVSGRAHSLRRLSWRTMRSGVGPRFGERAELLLRARRGRAAGARCPAPSHQAVLAEMVHKFGDVLSAVARGVCDLLADLCERLA